VGIVTPGYQLVDVRNEHALTYDGLGVAKLHETADAALSFIRLHPGLEIPPYFHEDVEESAVVLSGTLTYPYGAAQVLSVAVGQWVVAVAGDRHGYANRGDRPLTLLLFSPASTPTPGRPGTRMLSRIFRPLGEPRPRLLVYETDVSRGELVALRPGERVSLARIRYSAVYCFDGRIMCLMRGDRLALEAGEGVTLVHTEAEIVGASGQSTAAVFSTLY